MKISSDQIKIAYKVSRAFYLGQLSRQEAIAKLVNVRINPRSAAIIFQVYQHLMDGEKFTRTLSAATFEYFLDKILSDDGKEQLIVSLESLKKHMSYLETKRSYKMGLVGRIYDRYLALVTNIFLHEATGDSDELSFPEGKEKYRLHKFKERNRQLIALAKERHKTVDPKMRCQVCKFSFAEVYGDFGDGFIEAHHIFPISDLKIETQTRVEDLALVCSNCHRMLHKKRPWLKLNELKELLKFR